jgi:hypothetical protein
VTTPQEIQDRLAAPFDPAEVKFKPQAVKGERALAIAYVDARVVMDRLDDVLGVAGWQDEFAVLPCPATNQVSCAALGPHHRRVGHEVRRGRRVRPAGRRRQAEGRLLRRPQAHRCQVRHRPLPVPAAATVADFDPAKKLFATPTSPPMLAPKNSGPAKATKPAKAAAPEQPRTASGELPKDVPELLTRIAAADKALADRGQAPWGELTNYVVGVATKAGYSADKAQWDASVIDLAVRAVREYKKQKGIA